MCLASCLKIIQLQFSSLNAKLNCSVRYLENFNVQIQYL